PTIVFTAAVLQGPAAGRHRNRSAGLPSSSSPVISTRHNSANLIDASLWAAAPPTEHGGVKAIARSARGLAGGIAARPSWPCALSGAVLGSLRLGAREGGKGWPTGICGCHRHSPNRGFAFMRLATP